MHLVKTETTIRIVIELDDEELDWIHGMSQNYLGDGMEGKEDHFIRSRIWSATDSIKQQLQVN